ncbi:MAG: transglycosylase SLT domain-containing protein [Acidobacteriaceae bacterium]
MYDSARRGRLRPSIYSTTMLTFVFILHLALPWLVAQQVTQALAADSSSASETFLIPYRGAIEEAAARESLPPSLIAAVIQEESRFDPWATRAEARYVRSRAIRRAARRYVREHPHGPTAYTELLDRSRSYGLMQVMGETAREQGFARPFLAELYVPANAIAHGAKLLARLLHRYHNDTLSAISAYNQGTARRVRRGRQPVFVNARYVYRVAIAWRAYRKLFAEGTRTP